jgi:hypothetical protein
VFWVIRNRSLPSPWSSARERWDALGSIRPGDTLHRGAGRPASRLVHTPWGPRKSGMPESVLMPAPVKATMCSDPAIQRAVVSMYFWKGLHVIHTGAAQTAFGLRLPARRSRAYPLTRGRYEMETNTITATKNNKNKAIAPRKIAPTTASSLRFGLNMEPSGTLASSGRSGS